MKAVIHTTYGTADLLEVGTIERPEIGDDEVLIRVHAAGVDRGVWHFMAGLPYPIRLAGGGLRRPKNPVLGLDLAGVVEAVGKDVTRFEQAATVAISGLTALQALRDHGKVRPGQEVLVIGASGGVGTYAVQLAKAFGATVTGVCSTTTVDLVRSIGADHVIDYLQQDFAESDRRFDLIIDIGGNSSLSRLRKVLTPKGTLIIVGGEGGGRWLGGLDRQMRASAQSPFVGQKQGTFISRENHEDMIVLADLIEAGKVTPAVDRSYPLSEAAHAIRHIEEGRARGKVVVRVAATDGPR